MSGLMPAKSNREYLSNHVSYKSTQMIPSQYQTQEDHLAHLNIQRPIPTKSNQKTQRQEAVWSSAKKLESEILKQNMQVSSGGDAYKIDNPRRASDISMSYHEKYFALNNSIIPGNKTKNQLPMVNPINHEVTFSRQPNLLNKSSI